MPSRIGSETAARRKPSGVLDRGGVARRRRAVRRPGVRAARRRDRSARPVGGLRVHQPAQPASGHRDHRGPAARRLATSRRSPCSASSRRRGAALRPLATHRRRHRVLRGVPCAARRGRHPLTRALPAQPPVPDEYGRELQARLRPRLPDRRSRLRGPLRTGDRAAHRRDPTRGSRDPVGRLLGGPRPRGRDRLDGRRCLGALCRPGDTHHAAHPGGGPRRLPPLLRDVPDVAHARSARHGAHRPHGELRGRELGTYRRLAAPRGPEGPAQPGRPVLRAAHRPGDAGHARVPRDRAADRRRRWPASQAATASRYLDDFGVAMYCGFGRQPGQDGLETMREHSRVVGEVVGARRS